MDYETIRKYIGPLEIAIIMLITFGLAYWLNDKKETVKQAEEIQQEVQGVSLQPELTLDNTTFHKNAESPFFKVLDSIYSPFMVDSLCRFRDAEAKTGYLTLTKNAPFYRDLCSTGKEYYMFVRQEQYFPQGELLKIVGVAENKEIIQFHFTRGNETEALEDVMMRMDSTIRLFNQVSGTP